MSDFELPGMWESADFMGGRTDCEPLKPHPSSDAWQQMIDAVEELTAKTAYQEDEIDRLTALTEGDPTSVYHELAEARAWGIKWRDKAAEHRAMAEPLVYSQEQRIRIMQDVIRRNLAPWEQP